jgi:hypothetical protein
LHVVVVDVVAVIVGRSNFVTVSCCSTSLLLLLLLMSLFLVAMASRFHVADHLSHLQLSSCIASWLFSVDPDIVFCHKKIDHRVLFIQSEITIK